MLRTLLALSALAVFGLADWMDDLQLDLQIPVDGPIPCDYGEKDKDYHHWGVYALTKDGVIIGEFYPERYLTEDEESDYVGCDNTCLDTPDFKDAQGYGCNGWEGYTCDDATGRSYGYELNQMREIRANCRNTCDCDSDNPQPWENNRDSQYMCQYIEGINISSIKTAQMGGTYNRTRKFEYVIFKDDLDYASFQYCDIHCIVKNTWDRFCELYDQNWKFKYRPEISCASAPSGQFDVWKNDDGVYRAFACPGKFHDSLCYNWFYCDNTGLDNPMYRDKSGFSCSAWEGRPCDNVAMPLDFTHDDMEEVRANCQKTCDGKPSCKEAPDGNFIVYRDVYPPHYLHAYYEHKGEVINCDNAGLDFPDFKDAKGFGCADWAGFSCDNAYGLDAGYSEEQMQDVRVNCRKTCNT